MTAHKPNAEQREIIGACRTGGSVKINAGAGTGKTSTLELIARAMPSKRMLYIAYNKAIQVEAAGRFPRNVTCKTTHGLAYMRFGRQFAHRLNGKRVMPWEAARVLRIGPVELRLCAVHGFGECQCDGKAVVARYTSTQAASLVGQSVDRFCQSADEQPEGKHVPWQKALSAIPGAQIELAGKLEPFVQAAWQDVLSTDGQYRFTHDCYLKMFQLSKPRLPYDVIFLDEAQDTNECVTDIVMRQAGSAQLVLVGDQCQAIYGWRGATDAMAKFDAEHELFLSGSYRFGPAIADEANLWLEALRSPLRLRGFKQLQSTIGKLDVADAVLCRSNVGCIVEAMAGLAAGQSVAIVGGGAEIERLAKAASNLMAGVTTDHPDLAGFATWREVTAYVKEHPEDAGTLAPLVKMVDAHGPEAILDMTRRLVDERKADLVISTAHKAKGREWPTVRVSDDFYPPKDGAEPRRDEMMLAYVTVTRAKLQLDLGSLGWIRHVRGGVYHAPAEDSGRFEDWNNRLLAGTEEHPRDSYERAARIVETDPDYGDTIYAEEA